MEKLGKKNIVSALAIFASRVCACVASSADGDHPTVIGLGRCEGRFMGEKGVLDIDHLCRAIRDALGKAREEAGECPPRALVSISGGSVQSEKSRGMITLGQRGGEITQKSIDKVLKIADTIPVNIEREIIHSIPQGFVVDGQAGVGNPAGLYGVKLEVETLLITAYIPFLQNVTKCLNLAGIEAEEIVFSGLATSKSILPPADTDKRGILLMEIDNNFTALSIFFDDILRGIDIHPGSIIADDALASLRKKADNLRNRKPISKILLAGGSYVHEDFVEKVDSVFGIPSQMAYARNVRGTAKDITHPAHLTSIGLALYGLQKRKQGLAGAGGGRGLLNAAARRVSNFFTDYF